LSLLDLPIRSFFRQIAPNVARFAEQNKFRANRFIFDDNTVERIGRLCRERPDVILDNLQFASWPYETTYVEWRSDIFSNIINEGRPSGPYHPDGSEDREVGVLYHKGLALTLVGVPKPGTASEPIEAASMLRLYNYGAPRLSGTRRAQTRRTTDKLACMFGGTHNFVMGLPEQKQEQLAGMVDIDYVHDAFLTAPDPDEAFRNMMLEGAGEFRTVCALLLWLNQPRWTEITRVGASRRMLRNKSIAYAAHNVVTLKDMSVKRMAAVLRSQSMKFDRETPRRHTVRGFFRHYHRVAGCIHEWPFEPNEKEQWVCGRCGTMRVWVPAHERGDAGKGFVTKEYVTE
jgi:hypothetical protein